MTPTQEHLLKLLGEIDDICVRNDIEYFIDFGTMLGAVRHDGFIPWDDDADITLTEENYYKWVEACKRELDPSVRVYNDVRLDREFPTVFGRYNDVTTARVGEKSEFWKPICGQCIDVFYLLELPGDPVKKQEAIDYYFAYDEYVNASFRHFRLKTDSIYKIYQSFLDREKKVGREQTLREIEANIFHKHYDDCDTYISCSARMYGPPSIVPKKSYDTVYMADFEGRKFPIAGGYVELLYTYYGDTWNMIPDHKKGHSKMSHSGLGADVYVNDYMRFIDKDALLKKRLDFKRADVDDGYKYTLWNKKFFTQYGRYELMKISKRIAREKIDLEACLDPESPEKMRVLDNLFSDYYEIQLDASVRSWKVAMNLGDRLEYAALFNLAYNRGDLNSINKIIRLWDENQIPLSPKIQEIWDLVLAVREVRARIVYGRLDEALELADASLKIYPHSRDLKLYRLDILTKKVGDREEALMLRSQIEDLHRRGMEELAGWSLNIDRKDLEDTESNGQISGEEKEFTGKNEDHCLKLLADMDWMLGEKERAAACYDRIMTWSLNGLLQHEIKTSGRWEGSYDESDESDDR